MIDRSGNVGVPGVGPGAAEQDGAEVEDGLATLLVPLHARQLEALAGQHLAARLGHAAADGQRLGLVARVVHVPPPLRWTRSAGTSRRRWRGCPGWPPRFLRGWSAGGGGRRLVWKRSEEGGREELLELAFSLALASASCCWSWPICS